MNQEPEQASLPNFEEQLSQENIINSPLISNMVNAAFVKIEGLPTSILMDWGQKINRELENRGVL